MNKWADTSCYCEGRLAPSSTKFGVVENRNTKPGFQAIHQEEPKAMLVFPFARWQRSVVGEQTDHENCLVCPPMRPFQIEGDTVQHL